MNQFMSKTITMEPQIRNRRQDYKEYQPAEAAKTSTRSAKPKKSETDISQIVTGS